MRGLITGATALLLAQDAALAAGSGSPAPTLPFGAWLVAASWLLGLWLFVRFHAANRQLLAQNAALRGELAEMKARQAELRRTADEDPVTRLPNLEAFLRKLAARRRRADCGTLLMVNADPVRQVSGIYGRHAADRALLAVAGAISGVVRGNDQIGRIGGEEFAILLAGAGRDEALVVAERIRLAVEEIAFEPAPGVRHRLAVSVGGRVGCPAVETGALLADAAICLHAAKAGGRTLVVNSADMPAA